MTRSTGPRPRAARSGGPSISHSASALGVAEAGAQQEAVELRLGERVRALVLDRVLGRQDEEGPLERPRDAVGRHLPLLHRLEQRRLRLRGGAVDLVGQQEVREDRAGAELEVAVALVPDRRPGHVGGQEVGRELDAAEAEPARLCEGPRCERLRDPGHVLEQHVPVGEEAEQHQLELLALADDGALDLVEQAARRSSASSLKLHQSRSRARHDARRARPAPIPGACRSGGCRPIGPDELPGLVAEHRVRPFGLRSRLMPRRDDSSPAASADDCRPQAEVEVECGRSRHRHLALEPGEACRRSARTRGRTEARVERRRRLGG